MTDTKPALITPEGLHKELEYLSKWAKEGCLNHGCRINPPKGMGTNSSCACTPRAFSEHLLWLSRKLEVYGKYGRFPNKKKEGEKE